MKDGKCIYCKSEAKLNEEDAFPLSLRQPNTPKWIIDNHLCEKCNSKFGTQLDVILSQKSPVGFIFDIIQRELGHNNEALHASPYHKQVSGVKPIRLLFPNPVYDDLIVLHEPERVNHQLNVLEVVALQPQMILTKYDDGQTSREVIEENNRKYTSKSFGKGNWYTHDENEDVFCLFGNTYIFPKKTTHRYLAKPDEFKSKFMKDYPDMKYGLRVISPKEGQGIEKFDAFFEAIQGEHKEMIPEDKHLPIEVFRNPITLIMDKKGKSFFTRSIAKLAFHSFLYHYPNYKGCEPTFNGIKNYISRDSGMPAWYVRSVVPNEVAANSVYQDEEHQHFFGYFIKDKNIGCHIDLFTGLRQPPFSYDIVLAGEWKKIPKSTENVKRFPFFVHQKSPLKKMVAYRGKRIVAPSGTNII